MLVGSLKPGANVKLTIWRSGGAHDFNLKLERRAEERLAGRSASPEAEGAADRLGLKVAGLTPELAAQLGTGDLKGVLVLETDAKVAADTVRKGDVIRELNRVAVDSVAAYRRELTRLKAGEPVLLRIAREGRTLFVAVEAR